MKIDSMQQWLSLHDDAALKRCRESVIGEVRREIDEELLRREKARRRQWERLDVHLDA